jgi:hypothetical protein
LDSSKDGGCDARTGRILCLIRLLDNAANTDAPRRRLDPSTTSNQSAMSASDIVPLLRQMVMADYAATGFPPASLGELGLGA